MLVAAGAQPERASFAVCTFAAWRDDPVSALMSALHAAAVEALGRELTPWQPGGPVVPTLRAWTERVRTLLVVLDQFEDYFLYHGTRTAPTRSQPSWRTSSTRRTST